MVQKLENEPTADDQPKNPPSPKSRLAVLKRNKKPAATSDPFRFQGNGVTYKGKLIGERDVESARGDAMCADAMRAVKAAVKAAGAHKTRIILQINIDGIKIVDEKSNAILHNFPVSRVSFIARDTTDARAFGIVFGQPDNKYKFYGIKTAQTADQAVLAIRDMFQVVFEMKKKHIEQVKQQQEERKTGKETEPADGVAVADLLDLETEVQQIQQGLQQLEQIPTGTDAFGSTPFADPFQDSFVGNNPLVNGSSMNTSLTSSTQPQYPSQFPPHSQNAGWPRQPGMPLQVPPSTMQVPVAQAHAPFVDAWGAPQITHTQSTPAFVPNGFSETNPFASVAVATQHVSPQTRDPFDIRNVLHVPQTIPTGYAADWGMKENAAPQMQHASSFTTTNCFGDNNSQNQNQTKWEEPRKVTSLEEAFTKLVDMNALVARPANDTKKNPFEHILNPPKASLNALGAMPMHPPPAVMANHADPFGDDFFR
ncbi:phosphotyrosine interaction domain protein [Necator americanus]|uniref:Phosphotyrosine interaction domain protein n=1 Tax=Necator americanus TaxID=51031 RepID=W2T0Y9_NECAM|nr:phosphotyrosine interaction domain protein [Necator americanus]ETN74637.1 phosphotyrosine interaction domain protein [Necator americanus]